MIGLAQNQSTNSARFYPIWRWHTCARNSQKMGKSHQNGRNLLEIMAPMSPPKPNHTAYGIGMWHLNKPTFGPKTGIQPRPFAKSP
jgi:hypothetical protein